MHFQNFEKDNKIKIIIILFMIYVVGVIIYYSLGNFYKHLGYVPDERLYIQAAKALANGDGLYYNGVKGSFQKIVYSAVISPAYLVKDLFIQIKLVCLIGTLFNMTSVFPIYLICRKLKLNRVKSLFVCLFCLSFPMFLFSMTFMSETAFLPLWLWTVYFILLMLDSNDTLYVPIILGILSYLLYMCKEVGIVAIPALFVLKIYLLIIKREALNRLIPCFISVAVFAVLFLLGRYVLFDGELSSYSYGLVVPKVSDTSDKNSIYVFFYSFLFFLGYLILISFVFPIFFRAKGDCLINRFSLYLEISILLLVIIVVYKISLNEDYGLLSPRLHLRYFEPLLIPYFICFVTRLDSEDEDVCFESKYSDLALLIYLVVIILLPGLNQYGILDATTTGVLLMPEKISNYFFLGSPRKTLFFSFLMKLIIVLVIILERKTLKTNKKVFTILFLSISFFINFVGVYIKVNDIRQLYKMPRCDVEEMQIINDELKTLSGDKLIITNESGRLADVVVTYYDINNTDVYLAKDEYIMMDKNITLKAGNNFREVNIDEYDYIVYSNNVLEVSDRESISPDRIILTTQNFIIIEN